MDQTPLDTEVQTQIDWMIRELEARIIQLKVLRNTCSPVARVPVEVLSRIFRFSSPPIDADDSDSEGGYKTALLTLTWVSHYWRNVALDDATLWAMVIFEKKKSPWPFTCIKRSKDAELYLTLTATTPSALFGKIHRKTGALLPRIRSLRLLPFSSPLLPAWTEPAPVLEQLHLRRFSIPDDAFSGFLPALKDLSLVGCKFSSPALLLSGLTKLEIWKPISRIRVDHLLERLSSMVSLTSLEMEEALEPPKVYPDPAYMNRLTVSLPHLSDLYLGDSANAATQFIENTRYSLQSLKKFEVDTGILARDDTETEFAFRRLFNASQHLFQDHHIVIRHLDLLAVIQIGWQYLSNDSLGDTEPVKEELPTFSISVQDLLAPDIEFGYEFPILSDLDLSNLKSLTLEWWDSPPPIPHLVNIFGELPHLSEIRLQGYTPRAFLPALFPILPDSDPDTPSTIYFRALQILRIYTPGPDNWDTHSGVMHKKLRGCLEARESHPNPHLLKVLEVSGYNMLKFAQDELATYVEILEITDDPPFIGA